MSWVVWGGEQTERDGRGQSMTASKVTGRGSARVNETPSRTDGKKASRQGHEVPET
jgi:hypothetical protein